MLPCRQLSHHGPSASVLSFFPPPSILLCSVRRRLFLPFLPGPSSESSRSLRSGRARDAAPSFSCLLLCKLLSAPARRPPFPSPPLPPRPQWRSGNSLPPFSARFRLIAHSSSRGPSRPHPLSAPPPSLLSSTDQVLHIRKVAFWRTREVRHHRSLLRGRPVIFAGRCPNHMNPCELCLLLI